jgi:lipid-A-disaccharide synthase-like uncharacterized protein
MTIWVILGFIAQGLFASRFLVQWIVSEKRKQSTIPIYFWYSSVFGGGLLLIYAIHIKDPVFITGQSFGLIVYIRNLVLIYRKKIWDDFGTGYNQSKNFKIKNESGEF